MNSLASWKNSQSSTGVNRDKLLSLGAYQRQSTIGLSQSSSNSSYPRNLNSRLERLSNKFFQKRPACIKVITIYTDSQFLKICASQKGARCKAKLLIGYLLKKNKGWHVDNYSSHRCWIRSVCPSKCLFRSIHVWSGIGAVDLPHEVVLTMIIAWECQWTYLKRWSWAAILPVVRR